MTMNYNMFQRTTLATAGLALALLLGTVGLAVPSTASAQTEGGMITPNYKDADLSQIIEAVSAVTGKNFIVDPRVKAQVTMLSSSPMTPAAFYEAFLSILQVHGFVAVPSGSTIKIIPDANARQVPANDLPSRVSSSSDEIVTQVVAVKNVSAAQLVPILRPLIPQYGHLAAYPASNMLIISDRASNVNRMMRIIQRIDQQGDEAVDVIPLQHASAVEVVRIVNNLYAGSAAAEGAGMPSVKIIADERTNSVLVSGETSQRLRLKTLVAHLDTPLESGGDTQVRYLRYADAEKLAAKLREQIQGIVAAAATTGGAGGGAAAGGAAPQPAPVITSTGQGDKSVAIWAEPQTNALVVTAPPKVMRSVMAIVDRLDIRRYQVLVEAILVEMSIDKARDLGINWVVADRDSDGNLLPGAGFLNPINGTGLGEIIQGILDPESVTSLPPGFTAGVGQINETGTSWAALIRAIDGIGNTNIISTPSIVTLDNEEAEIKVAQEVPFITGQYTNQGVTGGNGNVNPFTTVQREEVGNILKITPQINEGSSVLLKIAQEASSIAASSQQVSDTDLITNKRTITTNVMVEDGGIVVLGGLIEDQVRESTAQVPFLGSIPLIGELFKTRSIDKVKSNLMVFIRPRILRDGVDAAIESNAKYNYMRDQQQGINKGKVPLMPRERQPTLPPLEQLVPPELLNPAREAAPAGATPAERIQQAPTPGGGSQNPVETAPVPPRTTPTPPPTTPTTPPTTPTTPYGQPTTPPADATQPPPATQGQAPEPPPGTTP
jgi:general secretion pathway protein D